MRTDNVYFAAADGRVKVGTTTKRVSDRVTSINSYLAKPLQIIGFIPGGLPLERAIQRHLKPWQISGEWFRDCSDVREILEKLLASGAAAIGFEDNPFRFEHEKKSDAFRPRPSNGREIGEVARVMWGALASKELAAFAGVDEAVALTWMSNRHHAPVLVGYALGAVVLDWIRTGRAESFLNDDRSAA